MATNSNTVIVDCSAVICYLFEDEIVPLDIEKAFISVLSGKIHLYSSPLLLYETANTLRTGVIRNRMDADTVIILLKKFKELPIQYIQPIEETALSLAITHTITYYDAVYLELAIRFHSPLLTLDKRLEKIALPLIAL
jgi:predicted nucleic acid-binding protein